MLVGERAVDAAIAVLWMEDRAATGTLPGHYSGIWRHLLGLPVPTHRARNGGRIFNRHDGVSITRALPGSSSYFLVDLQAALLSSELRHGSPKDRWP